jgi:phosphoribosylformylglycinamidine cyclo-ligase
MLHNSYATRFPESFSPETKPEFVYNGPWKLTDEVVIDGNTYSIGKLLLSPTRTYMPILMPLIREYRKSIQGIIHCTGGGYSKVLKFLSPNISVHIENAPPVPHLFQLIHEASDTSLAEMYKVFNMGVRMMLFADKKAASSILDLASAFGIKAYVMGEVRKGDEKKEIIIHTGNPKEPLVVYS